MDRTFKKLDSIFRSGFSPNSASTLDGIGYSYTFSEIANATGSRTEAESRLRDRKKFDDDDELCVCVDPCDHVFQARCRKFCFSITKPSAVPNMSTLIGRLAKCNIRSFRSSISLSEDLDIQQFLDSFFSERTSSSPKLPLSSRRSATFNATEELFVNGLGKLREHNRK